MTYQCTGTQNMARIEVALTEIEVPLPSAYCGGITAIRRRHLPTVHRLDLECGETTLTFCVGAGRLPKLEALDAALRDYFGIEASPPSDEPWNGDAEAAA